MSETLNPKQKKAGGFPRRRFHEPMKQLHLRVPETIEQWLATKSERATIEEGEPVSVNEICRRLFEQERRKEVEESK